MSASTDTVERALDRYIASFKARSKFDPDGVKAATLAKLAGVSRYKMSNYLQEYRQAQDGAHPYAIACRGYGRKARWTILRKPGSDPKAVQRARVAHSKYVMDDAVYRIVRDHFCEVMPGLTGTAADAEIETISEEVVGYIRLAVSNAERRLGRIVI